MSDTAAARPEVDRLALQRLRRRLDHAEALPWLHAEAARRMAERLPLIKLQPQRVLDCSGAAGASAPWLQQAYPDAEHRALADEAAPAAPRRWWRRRPQSPQAVTADQVAPGSADLLWSNMRLHWLAEPQAVLRRWHQALAVDGFLMFSTLGPGSLPELREVYRANDWGEPFAPFVDMHDLGDMLAHAGFADPVMDQELLTLSWPDADALLAELRGLGANVSNQRLAGLRTPRWRRRLADSLQAPDTHAGPGRPSLSVELVYGHAFRAAVRPRVQPETAVSLDAMRAMVRSPQR
ncbi:MAG: methyltransferase domain-containing protein [Proteobacteria bacterium]|nr:methyltransferase domain-containing protein [Pseudomonadota bacterium]